METGKLKTVVVEVLQSSTAMAGLPCPAEHSGGQDLRLKLQQLAHEAEVGGDDASPLLHELKGLIQLGLRCSS